jgi:hypothetical protein
MLNLQNIIKQNLALTKIQLKAERELVREIQIKLANLGLYPGGGWIDGALGPSSWKGLIKFCDKVGGITIPSENVALDAGISQKLLEIKQINSILDDCKKTSDVLAYLEKVQQNSRIVNSNAEIASAFVARTINSSPFQGDINNYPSHLEQKPDGNTISFIKVSSSWVEYPDIGGIPTIDSNSLNFLAQNFEHACVCIGGFDDANNPIKTRWFGNNPTNSIVLWWSTTKFVGMLNTVCQINENSPATDIDDCIITGSGSEFRFAKLVKDMVTYQGESSNAIGALFKSFSKREVLSSWIKAITGNSTVDFRGKYGEDSLIEPARIIDKAMSTGDGRVLSSGSIGKDSTSNKISAYDLTRLLSMVGWHQHLPPTAQLPFAQWKSLESVVRSMGNDTARYVDVALETLGLVNVITEPVVFSKVGWGNDNMTYAAFVKFVDRREIPAKLRTFALALRSNPGSSDFDVHDTNIAVAVTEIIRRIVTEELI